MHTVDLGPLVQCPHEIIIAHFDKGEHEVKGTESIAVLDAEYVISAEHVVYAAAKAFLATKRLTRSLSEELVFNLSPSTNISDSLKLFRQSLGRIVVVDLEGGDGSKFREWCSLHIQRPELSLDQLDALRVAQLKDVFGGGESKGQWLASVACKSV